jgi:phage tail tape-measure protein
MKRTKETKKEKILPALYPSHEQEVITVAGAIAGATTGALAGPPGIAAGAAIGAAIGMTIGRVLDREDERKHKRSDILDEEIGITAGELGASPDSTVNHGDRDDVTTDDQALLESLEEPKVSTNAEDASRAEPCADEPGRRAST